MGNPTGRAKRMDDVLVYSLQFIENDNEYNRSENQVAGKRDDNRLHLFTLSPFHLFFYGPDREAYHSQPGSSIY